jgi:hypothetical protein
MASLPAYAHRRNVPAGIWFRIATGHARPWFETRALARRAGYGPRHEA